MVENDIPKVVSLRETDSTNNQMRQWLSSERVPAFSVIRADYQTAGRGQVGNRWESAPGQNLLMSIVLRPAQLDVHQQFYLSMAVSNAILQVLRPYVPNVKVKWPNDIYVGDKKLAGILIENTLRGSLINDTIVGLGLNVNQREFVSDAPNPVSMANITGRETEPAALAEAIVVAMRQWMYYVNGARWSDIVEAYMCSLYRFDGQMHPFATANGHFSARIIGIEPDGRLMLEDAGGIVSSYMFKEVEFVIP